MKQHSVEPIVPQLYRKSFNVRFFLYLFKHTSSSLPTKIFYILVGFYQKNIFKLNIVNFNMQTKVKLSWYATCHSYDVIELVSKLHVVMEYSFLFPLLQKLWKLIKKCKTYCRKATGLFFSQTRCTVQEQSYSADKKVNVKSVTLHVSTLSFKQVFQWGNVEIFAATTDKICTVNQDMLDIDGTLARG